MKHPKLKTLSSALVLLAATGCMTEKQQNIDTPEVTVDRFQAAASAAQALDEMSNGRSQAVEFFKGPDGLLGVVGLDTKTDERFIAWSSPAGKALIVGPVMHQGVNLTQKYQREILGGAGDPVARQRAGQIGGAEPANSPAAKPKAPEAEVAQSREDGPMLSSSEMRRVENAPAIKQGSSPRRLYMFHDPFCHYCAMARRELQPLIESGEVEVSFIPVAALGLKSLKAGAALLSSDMPNALEEAGGQLARQPSTPEAQSTVEDNTDLLGAITNRVATPTFVLVSQNGDPIYVQGVPRDMAGMVDSIRETES